MKQILERRSGQIANWLKGIIFTLLLFKAVFGQDSLMVRGYIHNVEASICMDDCSWYYLEPDPGFEITNLTMLPDPSQLELYMGMHVELWGHMVTCVMCEALNVTDVIILDEVPPTVVEGILTESNGWSVCMDGCDEFVLLPHEPEPEEPGLINSTITQCHPETTTSVTTELNGNELTLTWNNATLNCCVEPNWALTVEWMDVEILFYDSGDPCDCECNFDLTVTFGPFPPGIYNGHFPYGWETHTFDFMILNDPILPVNITTLGNPESLEPYLGQYVQITGYETWCVECGGIVPEQVVVLDDGCTMDINGDDLVNVVDIIQIGNCILTTTGCSPCMDINDDGSANILDIVELVLYILEPPDLPEQCYEIPEMGPCEAYIPVWFYNQETGMCEQTHYGGCEGNVAFWTEEECVELCE